MKPSIKNTALCMLFFIAKTMSFAQEQNTLEPLITDRPDQTESTNIVSKKSIQFETGAAYETYKNNGFETEKFTYNTTLVRYGLLNTLELRLGWDIADVKINDIYFSNVTSGFSPLLVGIKTSIAKENGWFPEIALLVNLHLPFTASSDYKLETTGFDFRFAFEHSLSEKSGLSYNLGAAWGIDYQEASYIYSIAYGYSISEKLGAYIEIFGDFPEKSRANHLWDTGLTYLITNNLQVDATVGTSITRGQDFFLSTGLSFRIPSKTTKS